MSSELKLDPTRVRWDFQILKMFAAGSVRFSDVKECYLAMFRFQGGNKENLQRIHVLIAKRFGVRKLSRLQVAAMKATKRKEGSR